MAHTMSLTHSLYVSVSLTHARRRSLRVGITRRVVSLLAAYHAHTRCVSHARVCQSLVQLLLVTLHSCIVLNWVDFTQAA